MQWERGSLGRGGGLDPRVITGKETERGKEEKVQLGKKKINVWNHRKKKQKNTLAMQQGCTEFVTVF